MKTSISSALQKLIKEHVTTADEIGILTGCATSTVYRWVRGDSAPPFTSMGLLARGARDARVREAIQACLVQRGEVTP